jgi:hypothetical protein
MPEDPGITTDNQSNGSNKISNPRNLLIHQK